MSRAAPWVLGAIVAVIAALAVGTLHRLPAMTDESSYLFQAQLFASGHWMLPAPALPQFFLQEHVLVTPIMASKYFPGTALLLAPGVRLGMPSLVPVLLTGATGGLLFAAARRAARGTDASTSIALLTVLLWLSAYPVLYSGTSYLSEPVSGAAWMLAYWAALWWYQDDAVVALVLVAVGLGWMAITRPLTALGVAVPVAALILPRVIARRAWRPLLAATIVGVTIVSILPIWSAQSTGSWRVSPWALYARKYETFDVLGFQTQTAAPTDSLPFDQAHDFDYFRRAHASYHPADVLPQLAVRVRSIALDVWPKWRLALVPFALLGLVGLGLEGLLALTALGCVILCYAAYWHPPTYSVYYRDVEPALSLVTAIGLVRALDWVGARTAQRWRSVGVGALAAALLVAVGIVVTSTHRGIAAETQRQRQLAALIASIPDPWAVVFVPAGPGHTAAALLVRNAPDLADERVWLAYDRGADNARLLELAPDRVAYQLDDSTFTLRRIAK